MKITIIGHGYVGLVTGCVMADLGHQVTVIGRNPEKIQRLKNGDPIIYEPGLKPILKRNLASKHINFRLDYESVKNSQVIFIAVGTPPNPDGSADLSAVIEVAEKIAQYLSDKHFTVVSCKSTVPIGTNKMVEDIINKKIKGKKISFATASCPEFLKEGSAVKDTLSPDRIVIGSNNKKAIKILIDLHKKLPGERVITDLQSAELIKYASNSMLATKISFANLISFYAEKTNADVKTVLQAVGLDKRIGPQFLGAGIGYGGSCFPKDVKALIHMGKKLKIDTSLIESTEKINQQAKDNFLNKIVKNIREKDIAVWGLSFKPNTDDIRFSPSLYLIDKLLNLKFKITVYDPKAMENTKQIYKDKLNYAKDCYECLKQKSGLIIATDWPEFISADLKKVKQLLKHPDIFDGRNIYDLKTMTTLGFNYYSIGRPTIKSTT
ncbi:MAG: UDP-glucose 6-dehydrogenase [Patescibacteria group bacterium]|nr:MAG: UDP-glucose 6-dehydrogenase [Patescibacteria group bacterium]